MYQFKNQLVAWSKCDNDCNFYKLLSEESACCQKTEMENANSDIRDQPPRFMWAFVVYPCRPRKGTDFTQNEATRMSNIGYQETGLWNRTPRFLMTCRQLLLDQQHEVISSIHRRYVGQYLGNVTRRKTCWCGNQMKFHRLRARERSRHIWRSLGARTASNLLHHSSAGAWFMSMLIIWPCNQCNMETTIEKELNRHKTNKLALIPTFFIVLLPVHDPAYHKTLSSM